MTLWTNNGTPNPPDWWADVTRDARLRFEAKIAHTLKTIQPYQEEDAA
ncbi:hypothetical protein [Frigoribacterium sp. UYMn621]